jgi:hypothetical protein
MKSRWLVLGAVAVVTVGVFVLKHIADKKDKILSLNDNIGQNIGELSHELPESEFDDIDFLS